MICVNELGQQKCNNRGLLHNLVILIAPFAPHIAEELWQHLGEKTAFVTHNGQHGTRPYLTENEVQLTISFNGKARFQMTFPIDASKEDVETAALNDERR